MDTLLECNSKRFEISLEGSKQNYNMVFGVKFVLMVADHLTPNSIALISRYIQIFIMNWI